MHHNYTMPMTPSAVDAADALSNLSRKKHAGKGTRRDPCDNCGGRISVKVSPAMKKILEDEKEPNICSACYNTGKLKDARRKVSNRTRAQPASARTPVQKSASAANSSPDPQHTQKKATRGHAVTTARASDMAPATFAAPDPVPVSNTGLAGSGAAKNVSAPPLDKVPVSTPAADQVHPQSFTSTQTPSETTTLSADAAAPSWIGTHFSPVDTSYHRWTITQSPPHMVNGKISAHTSCKKEAAAVAAANAKIRLLDIKEKVAEIKANKMKAKRDIERKKAGIQLQEQIVRDADEQLSTLEASLRAARVELGGLMAAAKNANDAQIVAEEREAAEERENADDTANKKVTAGREKVVGHEKKGAGGAKQKQTDRDVVPVEADMLEVEEGTEIQ